MLKASQKRLKQVLLSFVQFDEASVLLCVFAHFRVTERQTNVQTAEKRYCLSWTSFLDSLGKEQQRLSLELTLLEVYNIQVYILLNELSAPCETVWNRKRWVREVRRSLNIRDDFSLHSLAQSYSHQYSLP